MQLTGCNARPVNHAEHALDRVGTVAPLANGIGAVKAILGALAARSAAPIVPALFPVAIARMIAAHTGGTDFSRAAKGSIGKRCPGILRSFGGARLAVVAGIVNAHRNALTCDNAGSGINNTDASVVLAEIIGALQPIIRAFATRTTATVRAALLAVAVVEHAFAEVADLPAAAIPAGTSTTIVPAFNQLARNVRALPALARFPAPALAAASTTAVRTADLACAVGFALNLAFPADAHGRSFRALSTEIPTAIRAALLVVA